MVNIGVMNIPSIVDTAVDTTDKARLALPIYAIILLAVPPGQHATMIRPTANSLGSPNIIEINHPDNGMIVY